MEHDWKDEELTLEEREAFARLPRAAALDPLLEERTVRALRRRGLLRAASARRTPWRVAAAAAALALFAAGTAFGQWLGARQAADTLALQGDAMAAALQVQRTGTAWLDALAVLVAASTEADPAAARQAREVALAVYRGAGAEIERLEASDSMEVRHVVWF